MAVKDYCEQLIELYKHASQPWEQTPYWYQNSEARQEFIRKWAQKQRAQKQRLDSDFSVLNPDLK